MYRDLDRQRPKRHEVKPAGQAGGLYYFDITGLVFPGNVLAGGV